MVREPLCGNLTTLNLSSEGNLERTLAGLKLRNLPLNATQVRRVKTVDRVDPPIQLFLKSDHAPTGRFPADLPFAKNRGRWGGVKRNGSRVHTSHLLREAVEFDRKGEGIRGGQRELLQFRPREFIIPRPRLVRHTARGRGISLTMTHLLEPEAGSRAVEQSK